MLHLTGAGSLQVGPRNPCDELSRGFPHRVRPSAQPTAVGMKGQRGARIRAPSSPRGGTRTPWQQVIRLSGQTGSNSAVVLDRPPSETSPKNEGLSFSSSEVSLESPKFLFFSPSTPPAHSHSAAASLMCLLSGDALSSSRPLPFSEFLVSRDLEPTRTPWEAGLCQ